jgi:type III secretion protein V
MPLLNFLRRSDTILAVFVIAITVMLLIPLPTATLDFLLAFNISFSILLLLIGLYVNSSQALLVFPSILLLTTLFRLSLNVASSRLILSQGDAGRVIEAFGTFLIRGELAVGAIVFIMITIVNFIVVSKGSGRVSEVAARFVLEAMPGKQLAIDSELRSGVIDIVQAQAKREELRKETQLYASMDGAMKFVQGDAIAGLFIIVVNIFGGIYMGLQGGMSLGDALQTYSLLTVGDGLVTQIPAILISVCAGIIVTRVSSGDGATLGGDIAKQLFSNPIVLFWSSVLVLIMATLPGIPALPFVAVAAVFAGSGFLMNRRRFTLQNVTAGPAIGAARESASIALLPGSSSPDSFARIAGRELTVTLTADLFRLYSARAENYQQAWSQLRKDFYEKIGINLPLIKLEYSAQLQSSESQAYAVLMSGNTVLSGTVNEEQVLVETLPASAEVWGLIVEGTEVHPLSAARMTLVNRSQRALVDSLGLGHFDSLELIFLKVARFFQQNPEQIFGSLDVHSFLRNFEQTYPGVFADLLDRRFITVPRLTEVFLALVREGLSIKEPVKIIEALAAYCSTSGAGLVKEDDFVVDDIVAFIRRSLIKLQLGDFIAPRHSLRVLLLSTRLEDHLLNARRDDSLQSQFSFGAELPGAFSAHLQKATELVLEKGISPVFILCRPEVRSRVLALLRQAQLGFRVLSTEEIDPGLRTEAVAVLDVGY